MYVLSMYDFTLVQCICNRDHTAHKAENIFYLNFNGKIC
jgi:hypothetical protein